MSDSSTPNREIPELDEESLVTMVRDPTRSSNGDARALAVVRALERTRNAGRHAVEMPTAPVTQPFFPAPHAALDLPRGLGEVTVESITARAREAATGATTMRFYSPRPAEQVPGPSPAPTLVVGTPAPTPQRAHHAQHVHRPSFTTTQPGLSPSVLNDALCVTQEMAAGALLQAPAQLPMLGGAAAAASTARESQPLPHVAAPDARASRGLRLNPAITALGHADEGMVGRPQPATPANEGARGHGRLIFLTFACVLAMGVLTLSMHMQRSGLAPRDALQYAIAIATGKPAPVARKRAAATGGAAPTAPRHGSRDLAGPAPVQAPEARTSEAQRAKALAEAPTALVPTQLSEAVDPDSEGATSEGAATDLKQLAATEAEKDKQALFAQPTTAAALYIEGRYKEALAEYRMLATLHPDQPVYADFARILRRRLVEMCTRTQPHRQAECAKL